MRNLLPDNEDVININNAINYIINNKLIRKGLINNNQELKQEVYQVSVPILGVVENMSYYQCSKCDTKHRLFGRELDVEKSLDVPIIGRIPIKPDISRNCDRGTPSVVVDQEISAVFEEIVEFVLPALQIADCNNNV